MYAHFCPFLPMPIRQKSGDYGNEWGPPIMPSSLEVAEQPFLLPRPGCYDSKSLELIVI